MRAKLAAPREARDLFALVRAEAGLLIAHYEI